MENNKADMIEAEAGAYAEKIAFRVPYDGTNIFYDDKVFEASKRDYIAGRTVGGDRELALSLALEDLLMAVANKEDSKILLTSIQVARKLLNK